MKKYLVACVCALFLAGCAGTGESESLQPAKSDQAQVVHEPMPVEQPAPDVEKGKKKKGSKKKAEKAHKSAKHVAKSEATIREELKATARSLVTRASHTITPSKANKSVSKSSKGYVATYISIDPNNYSVDMRPASKAGQYVGFVRYAEQVYHCNGKTRSEALSAPCSPVQTRRLNEMIHYDGSQWRY